MSELDQSLSAHDSPHFWVGYLANVVKSAADKVNRQILDPGLGDELSRVVDEYESSPVARPREIVGLAVVAKNGECYAIRDSYRAAEEARADAWRYLCGAIESGHPRAVGYYRERYPFRVLCVDAQERDALVEDGTPVLDREP